MAIRHDNTYVILVLIVTFPDTFGTSFAKRTLTTSLHSFSSQFCSDPSLPAPSPSITDNTNRPEDLSSPIRVAPKPKRRKRGNNVFFDDRGFPDQSDEFDSLLHNVDGGVILRKRRHAAPALDDIDPNFATTYDDAIHGERLLKELDLSHLDNDIVP